MSVYPRTNKTTGRTIWHYDFVIGGRRVHGSTGQTTKRAAEAFEARRRREIAEGKDDRPPLTIDLAAGRWWADVGQHRSDARDKERCIEWLLAQIGPVRMIETLKTADVLDLVARRRAEPARNRARAVTSATVNRDVIGTLRPILRHAEVAYDVTLPRIRWEAAGLREGDTPVREEFSAAEIQAWIDKLEPIERAFLRLATRYGMRFGELFFPPEAVEASDPTDARLRIARYLGRHGWKQFRKGGGAHVLPLLEEDARLLGALASRAQAAGLETIWFEEDAHGLRALTYWGMQRRLRSAAKAAGLRSGDRLIHGMRHHVGTQILRATGNLKLAQQALGHRSIATTQRYAHASEGDLRAGIAATAGAVSRHTPDAPALEVSKTFINQED